MTPYYERDGITIYHGDADEILNTTNYLGMVDMVLTSPPYNTMPTSHSPSGLHGERKSGINQWIKKASEGYFDSRPEPEYQAWMIGSGLL